MADMREYRCDYYSVMAPSTSCLFCKSCTDVFWDFTNGPYMFLCDAEGDTNKGAVGECELFSEEGK